MSSKAKPKGGGGRTGGGGLPATRHSGPESRRAALVGNPTKDLISLGRQFLILILQSAVSFSGQSNQPDRKDMPILDAIYLRITASIYWNCPQKVKASCYLNIVLSTKYVTVVSVGIRGMDDKSPKSASIIKGVVPNQLGIRCVPRRLFIPALQ